MTKQILYNTILDAIKAYESNRIDDSKIIMIKLIKDDGLNKVDQRLYDLAMEFYIFIFDGDLRKEGRDFGFADTKEIRSALKKLK